MIAWSGWRRLAAVLILAVCATGAWGEEKPSDRVASGEMNAAFDVYGRSMLNALMAMTDQTLAEEMRVLKLLAATPMVRSGDWDTMREIVKSDQSPNSLGIVWYARPDGAYYTVDGPAKGNLADRPYFPALMSGESVSGALVYSKATGKKSLIVAVPVRRNGRVIGAVGKSLFLDRLSERIDRGMSLPPSMVFYCLSPDGRVILHRESRYIFEDPRELGSETLRVAGVEMLAKQTVEVSYEFAGFRRRVLCQASPITQWRFAVGINSGLAEDAGAARPK